MTQSLIIQLARDALTVGLMISAPLLGLTMIIGVTVSIFQAVTSIQEMTLSFVPKVLGICLAVLVFGPWMASTIVLYTTSLMSSLPSMAR